LGERCQYVLDSIRQTGESLIGNCSPTLPALRTGHPLEITHSKIT